MTDQPRELERQIDETRSEMDETIDALTARFNPRHMGERAADAVIRRAPEPPEAGRSFYARRPMLVGSIALAAGAGAGFLLSPPDTPGKPGSSGPGLMQRVKSKVQDTREQVMEKSHDLQENAKEALHRRTNDGESAMEEARIEAREHALGMKKVAQTTYEVSKQEAKEVADEAKQGARHVKEATRREAEAQDVTPQDAKARASSVRDTAQD